MGNIIAIILFGSAWGFLEATLGGFLHVVRFPFTGQIMSSIAVFIMMWSLRFGLRPVHLAGIAMIAAAFKFFDFFLFGVPIFDMTILNPAQAIIFEGLSFALAVNLFRLAESKERDLHASIFTVFLWAALFNGVSYFILFHKTMMNLYLSLPVGMILTFLSLKLFRLADRHDVIGLKWLQPVPVQVTFTMVFSAAAIISRFFLA